MRNIDIADSELHHVGLECWGTEISQAFACTLNSGLEDSYSCHMLQLILTDWSFLCRENYIKRPKMLKATKTA